MQTQSGGSSTAYISMIDGALHLAEEEMAVEYIFTFRFLLSKADRDIDALVERLGEAGCNDALVSTGLPGCVALSFVREADSAKAAMASALADARRVMPSTTRI